VKRCVKAGRLRFTTNYAEALSDAEFAFIAVGTPGRVDGAADLDYVRSAAEMIAKHLTKPLIVINKSTVPVGTGDWVADIIKEHKTNDVPFAVVSNPEFLAEGSAIADFQNTDRVVLGSRDSDAASRVAELYLPLRAKIMITNLRTAELIKYASNAFLATKISFINEIANICEKLGADVKEVAEGMGLDRRIGRAFLNAGLGYGGSCFEGAETVFALNSPNVAAEKLESIFVKAGQPFQGDVVQVVTPTDKRVLAFDLQTGQPTLAEVKAITRRPYQGLMVTLATSMGRTLKVTADHPVIVRAHDHFAILPAAAIAPGDQLMALCALPKIEAAQSLNLIERLRDTSLADDVYVSPLDDAFVQQYPQFAKHIPRELLTHPSEIKRRNRMSLRVFYHLRAQGVVQVSDEQLQLYTAKGAATKINAVIPIDADGLRLLGYYLAKGWISCDTGRAGATRERIGFAFNETETEYITDLQRILTRLGLKFSEKHKTHAITTIVSSRILAWLLRDVLQCGVRSDDKALPRLVFNVPAELQYELVRGAFSGDGAVTPAQAGRNLMYEYATVSKPLADGMALLLQTLGIVPSIRTRWMNKSKQLAYLVCVSGYAQLEALRHVFGEKRRAQIETILAGYQRHIKQRGFAKQGAYALLTVQAVAYEETQTTVYSMETSTGTLIASSGLICHNCFPKDVKALEHMAAANGCHPQLLRAVIEINQDRRYQVMGKLREILGPLKGKTLGLLGLAFKPNTDDMREAPAVDIAKMAQDAGMVVKGYDPVAMHVAGRMMRDVRLCEDAYELATGCDAIVIATEWNEFRNLDLPRIKAAMKKPVIIDGRNIYAPDKMDELGFIYRGMGRGSQDEHVKAE
jgi:UDPglucose 6-dehydrogenase